MRRLTLLLIVMIFRLSANAQQKMAEDYYADAFNEISDMLSGKTQLSIKRAVYLAEWAYYEGKLDYQKDFCDEIDRITKFLNLFYDVNKLSAYKTGKQIALNDYFFKPYSGNGYKPYIYDFEHFSADEDNWETQFVTKVLKTHCGQCRSLPWTYKILAEEIGAEVSIAYAPRHCYIMYKDEDNFTPEDWINLELTTHQMQPAFWIKQNSEICDSAVIVGTYMTPLNNIETVASQLSELAFGYYKKFNRYDDFTFRCASRSLEFYPRNPTALIIRGKSLEKLIQERAAINGNLLDDFSVYMIYLMHETQYLLDRTYMTVETAEIRNKRLRQAVEAEKYTKENLIPK